MKRVVVSAAAMVIGIALFAGLGSSDASASDNARFQSLNDRRMSSSAGVEHRRISSLNDRRTSSSPGTRATNAVFPLFFLGRLEAKLVLGAFVASIVFFSILTARFGFTRLLGLGHLAWIPLLMYLSTRLDAVPGVELFGIWMRALIVLNGVSLVIDTVDVVRYVVGARRETVGGL